MRLWDVATETAIRDHAGAFVRFSPAGGLLAAGGGGVNRTVRLHDTASGAEIGFLDNGPGYITSLAFSPDGSRIYFTASPGTVPNVYRINADGTGLELVAGDAGGFGTMDHLAPHVDALVDAA